MKLGHEFYPVNSLKKNQTCGVFLKKPKIWVNSRKFEPSIQMAAYPPFTKCTVYFGVTFCAKMGSAKKNRKYKIPFAYFGCCRKNFAYH